MRHSEIPEKILPQGATSVNENAAQISNQIADLMREKMTGNTNINVIVLNQKEEMAAYDAAAKAKAMGANPYAEVTFKKDADGNLIKVKGDGIVSKSGNYPKNEMLTLDFTSADATLFKKDEHGNLIKIPREGGPKIPTYLSESPRTGFDR